MFIIKQISVFVENKFGSAGDIITTLSKENINIRALSIADTADYGIMRLIVDNSQKAEKIIKEQGVMVKSTDVLAIPIGDKPGGLATVLEIFKDGEISVDYMYAFVGRKADKAILVTKTDDLEKSQILLEKAGISPLKADELYNV